MTARALELPDDGTIALWTSAVEMFNERASELAILQALNSFLSQSLSAEGENPMVRHNQLPEWRQKEPVAATHISLQLILCQTRKK